jgi:hypothetical protein
MISESNREMFRKVGSVFMDVRNAIKPLTVEYIEDSGEFIFRHGPASCAVELHRIEAGIESEVVEIVLRELKADARRCGFRRYINAPCTLHDHNPDQWDV